LPIRVEYSRANACGSGALVERYWLSTKFLVSCKEIALQRGCLCEKYQGFMDKYLEELVQKIPLKHLSSFLGIAPQSLSRIRKKGIVKHLNL